MSTDHTQTTAIGGGTFVQVRAATIEVRTGTTSGKRVRVETPRFVIGSGPDVDLRLEDRTVSREHVVVSLGPSGLVVRDEGSRNGTFLGAVRVKEIVLTGDTTLRVGQTTVAITVDNASIDIPISAGAAFGDAIGSGAAIRNVFHRLERAAETDVTVLLEGESGVGKDVLARAVHAHSNRAEQPFVAVDCGAIPATLFESELFGHVRGAFTGADQQRDGLAAEADGGTLFLDEVGELPLELQPKLLRLLEEREIRPVGGRGPRKVDIRIIAATNRGLLEAVSQGTFRQDLFYRLSVARVVVPPLRDRAEDIEALALAFLRNALGRADAQLDPDIASMLAAYRWPGNVRELKNVVERHALLGVRDRQSLFDAKDARGLAVQRDDVWSMPYHDARKILLEDFERTYLTRALAGAGNVVVRAAEITGIPRPTFYRMLTRLGLKPRDD